MDSSPAELSGKEAQRVGQIQLMQSPGGWTGKPRDDVQHWKAIAGREGNRARVLQSKASEEGMAGKDNDLRAGQSGWKPFVT